MEEPFHYSLSSRGNRGRFSPVRGTRRGRGFGLKVFSSIGDGGTAVKVWIWSCGIVAFT